MALPKQTAPKYKVNLPSDGKEVEFRPFLVKEQKILMLAQEEDRDEAMFEAVQDLIEAVTFGKIKPRSLPTIDLEFLFLKVRVKSVGETTTLSMTCHDPKCEGTGDAVIDLDNVEVVGDKPETKIMINDEIGVELRYPRVGDVEASNKEENKGVQSIDMLKRSMVNIFDAENVYPTADTPTAELDEFIDNLSVSQMESLAKFFASIPRLEKVVTTECKVCKKEIEKVLTGIQNFF